MDSPTNLDTFRSAFESFSLHTGEDYFKELVKSVSKALSIDGVWVSEFHREQKSMTTLAFWHIDHFASNFTYFIEGTPCERAINSPEIIHYAERLRSLFPHEHTLLNELSGESYTGLSLHDDQGEVTGSIAFINSRSTPLNAEIKAILQMIKTRSESELQRLRRERETVIREYQLKGLINCVQDLLINLDHRGRIVMLNSTAESVLNHNGVKTPVPIAQFLPDASRSKLRSLIETLAHTENKDTYVWIPGDFEIIPANGTPLSVEGTVSKYELDEKTNYTLVLRSRDDKAASGEKIKQLINETEYLREELEDIDRQSNKLVGESKAVRRLLQNVYMVAHTDATVLITGETGTGKELVARHIHFISSRKDKPLVSVNCGAIPAALIESEFFGHTKGSFTGATTERKGRFQLADTGTIFLDEIGELPMDLQVKLLRVIQEGELEPVGSSRTIKIDVRIIAATHRNLLQLVKENKFREDLYYRLHVFPIDVPPLRERENDVVLLANTFIDKFSKRINKKVNRLQEEHIKLLTAYSWPGNVRELQNVIERAVILAQQGEIDLTTILNLQDAKKSAPHLEDDDRILTKDELLELEKRNILKALKAANWKVSGKDGAAALLQMVPSTLSSRLSALNIKIPKE